MVTQEEIELSKVCEGKPTTTIRVILPLFFVVLPIGCGAHSPSISLPPYYQAEEKFEENEALLELVGTNTSGWTGLWEPIVREITKMSLEKMLALLKPIDG